MAILTGVGLLLLCALSGVLVADRLTPNLPALERRVLGLIAGFALLTITSYLAAMAGRLLLAPVLLAAIVAVLGAWRFLSPSAAARPLTGQRRETQPDRAASVVALVSLAVAFAAFAVPMLLRPMPQGWDPAFHSAIVESIRRLGALPTTWGPYEPGEKFNYPAAMHAAIALYVRLSGVSADGAFTLAFLVAGALMLAAVYALGVRFGGARAGSLSVLIYGLSDGWGTLASHANWGGLPNLAGLVLMAGFVLAVAEPGRGSALLAALLAAAMAFTHHLSFALLGFSFALLILVELVTERKMSPVGRAAFAGLALAVATAGVLVLVRPSGRFDLAHAFKFEREHITDLTKAWEAMGPVLLAGGGLGLCASLLTHREPGQRLLPAWAIGLVAFWVVWDIVYRAAIWWIVHGRWTALTPSRGLTDAAVPLSVCLAVMVARLLEPVPRRAGWAAVLAAGVALGALGYRGERDRMREARAGAQAFEDARALCREVKVRTPGDAILFAPNAGEAGIWLPYLCERELNYFPDPGYYQSPYREAKMRIQEPREFARYIATQSPRPVFYATRGRSDLPLLASASGWNLYKAEP